MNTLIICVVLHAGMPRTCWALPRGQTCEQAIREWVPQAYAWARRSALPLSTLTLCGCWSRINYADESIKQ